MAQPKPERLSIDQILKLVDQLPQNEQEQLQRNLSNRTWGQRWDELVKKIEKYNRDHNIPPLSDEEIMEEVKIVRAETKAKRDQSSY